MFSQKHFELFDNEMLKCIMKRIKKYLKKTKKTVYSFDFVITLRLDNDGNVLLFWVSVLFKRNTMGIEYNFRITKQDIQNLSRCPDGVDDLDQLLHSAPHFIEESESTYTYSEEPENEDRWPSNISIQEYGFCLCMYDRSSDLKLMDYLIHELLDRCGHVEVEDA